MLGLTWDEALDLTKDRSEWRDCTVLLQHKEGLRSKVRMLLSFPSVVNQRKVRILADYVKSCSANSVCMLYAHVAQSELDALQSSSVWQLNFAYF